MKVLSWHVPGVTHENHGNLRIADDPPRFETCISCFEFKHCVNQFCKIKFFDFVTAGFFFYKAVKSDDGTHTLFCA